MSHVCFLCRNYFCEIAVCCDQPRRVIYECVNAEREYADGTIWCGAYGCPICIGDQRLEEVICLGGRAAVDLKLMASERGFRHHIGAVQTGDQPEQMIRAVNSEGSVQNDDFVSSRHGAEAVLGLNGAEKIGHIVRVDPFSRGEAVYNLAVSEALDGKFRVRDLYEQPAAGQRLGERPINPPLVREDREAHAGKDVDNVCGLPLDAIKMVGADFV